MTTQRYHSWNDVNWNSTPFTRLIDDIRRYDHGESAQFRALPYVVVDANYASNRLGLVIEPDTSDEQLLTNLVFQLHASTRGNAKSASYRTNALLSPRPKPPHSLLDSVVLAWPGRLQIFNGTAELTLENRDRLHVADIITKHGYDNVSQPRSVQLRIAVELLNNIKTAISQYESGEHGGETL